MDLKPVPRHAKRPVVVDPNDIISKINTTQEFPDILQAVGIHTVAIFEYIRIHSFGKPKRLKSFGIHALGAKFGAQCLAQGYSRVDRRSSGIKMCNYCLTKGSTKGRAAGL